MSSRKTFMDTWRKHRRNEERKRHSSEKDKKEITRRRRRIQGTDLFPGRRRRSPGSSHVRQIFLDALQFSFLFKRNLPTTLRSHKTRDLRQWAIYSFSRIPVAVSFDLIVLKDPIRILFHQKTKSFYPRLVRNFFPVSLSLSLFLVFLSSLISLDSLIVISFLPLFLWVSSDSQSKDQQHFENLSHPPLAFFRFIICLLFWTKRQSLRKEPTVEEEETRGIDTSLSVYFSPPSVQLFLFPDIVLYSIKRGRRNRGKDHEEKEGTSKKKGKQQLEHDDHTRKRGIESKPDTRQKEGCLSSLAYFFSSWRWIL